MSREIGILQSPSVGASRNDPGNRGSSGAAGRNGGEGFLDFMDAGLALRASGVRRAIGFQRWNLIVESIRGHWTIFRQGVSPSILIFAEGRKRESNYAEISEYSDPFTDIVNLT